MYRQFFAVLFWTTVISAVATGTAKASQPCSTAQNSYATAKAAQMAADNDRAASLFKTTIEQFEGCRQQENMRSPAGLTDTSLEVDAMIAAASIALSNQEVEHAHALLIGATGLLTELCNGDSLPSDVSSQVAGNVIGLRRFGAMAGIPEFGACPAANVPGPSPTQ